MRDFAWVQVWGGWLLLRHAARPSMARSVVGVLPTHVLKRSQPPQTPKSVCKLIVLRAEGLKICFLQNSTLLIALSVRSCKYWHYHICETGYEYLHSGDVSGQEVRDRACHGWP